MFCILIIETQEFRVRCCGFQSMASLLFIFLFCFYSRDALFLARPVLKWEVESLDDYDERTTLVIQRRKRECGYYSRNGQMESRYGRCIRAWCSGGTGLEPRTIVGHGLLWCIYST